VGVAPPGTFNETVSIAKSLQSPVQLVRLKVTLVMLAAVVSSTPMKVASPLPSLVTGNVPREVPPSKAWMLAVNSAGPSDWITAPAPDTFFEVKFSVSGPLPLLPVSAVQIRLSPAANPVVPSTFQLHRVSGHTTATRLPAPSRVTEPVRPLVEVKLGVAVSVVASTPNCDHTILSLALKPPRLVTGMTVSACASAVANVIRTIAAARPRNAALCIDAPIP